MSVKIDRKAETEMEAFLDKLIVQKVQNSVKEDLSTQKTQLDELNRLCKEEFNKTQGLCGPISGIQRSIGESDCDETLMDMLAAVQDGLHDGAAACKQRDEDIKKELNGAFVSLTEKTDSVREDVDNVRKLTECLLHSLQKTQDSIEQTVREASRQEDAVLREKVDLIVAQVHTLENASEGRHEEGLALTKQYTGDLGQRLDRQAEQLQSLAGDLARQRTEAARFETDLLKRLDDMADFETALDEALRQRFAEMSRSFDQRQDQFSHTFEQKASLAKKFAIAFGVVEGIQLLLLLLHIFL